jgi:hypothetical protein
MFVKGILCLKLNCSSFRVRILVMTNNFYIYNWNLALYSLVCNFYFLVWNTEALVEMEAKSVCVPPCLNLPYFLCQQTPMCSGESWEFSPIGPLSVPWLGQWPLTAERKPVSADHGWYTETYSKSPSPATLVRGQHLTHRVEILTHYLQRKLVFGTLVTALQVEGI